jgi:hypothetical protein
LVVTFVAHIQRSGVVECEPDWINEWSTGASGKGADDTVRINTPNAFAVVIGHEQVATPVKCKSSRTFEGRRHRGTTIARLATLSRSSD